MSTGPHPPGPRMVVCIKQVPDSAQIRVHPVTNTIMRQ
ncbi:electron transfer flavoprotein alpha/beta subunit, partial [Roseospira goensis]|nr:electron transfer flavoprotein alpha/beta subunit [Roseospira goensis]